MRSTWTDPDSWMIPKTLGDYPCNEPYRPVLITLITLIFGSSRSELLIFRRHLPHRIISSIFRDHIFSAFSLRNPKFGCSCGEGAAEGGGSLSPFLSAFSWSRFIYETEYETEYTPATRKNQGTRGDKERQGGTRGNKKRPQFVRPIRLSDSTGRLFKKMNFYQKNVHHLWRDKQRVFALYFAL